MSVRRHAARLAMVCALLGGLVAVGASPAFADGDRVEVRSASSFSAGGSPGSVSVEVRKRSDGCVILQTGLGLRLDGLAAEQVQVQVNLGGRWSPVPVSGGGGSVTTARTSPAKPMLCKGKSITVRYRVAFAAGTPAGRLEVLGEAASAAGRVLGRAADTSRVGGRNAAAATPSKKPSPTPSAVATVPAPAEDAPTAAAVAGPSTAVAEEESSGGSMIMFFGIAMVAVGAGLIALLVRRSRADKEHGDGVAAYPGLPGPRHAAGTTYRSGGGAPGATPAPPGQMYGQQAPAASYPIVPPPAGGMYGGTPAPRPTGGVYGAKPTSAPPAAGPGAPPAAPSASGDSTTFMPRLPG